MSPQAKGTPSDEDAARIRAAVVAKRLAEIELAAAVLDAMRNGASIRETALVADVSDRTILRWRKGQGLPTREELREASEQRRRDWYEQMGLSRVREMLDQLDAERAAGDTSSAPESRP